jgi:hypothetical protein
VALIPGLIIYLTINATIKSQKLLQNLQWDRVRGCLLREYASFFYRMPGDDCGPTGEDLSEPSSVHKRSESIIKLPLITDGYFTAGAQLWKCSFGLFLFQHGT